MTDSSRAMDLMRHRRWNLGVGALHVVQAATIPHAAQVRIRLAATDATDDQPRGIVERAESRSAVRDALARELPMKTEIATG